MFFLYYYFGLILGTILMFVWICQLICFLFWSWIVPLESLLILFSVTLMIFVPILNKYIVPIARSTPIYCCWLDLHHHFSPYAIVIIFRIDFPVTCLSFSFCFIHSQCYYHYHYCFHHRDCYCHLQFTWPRIVLLRSAKWSPNSHAAKPVLVCSASWWYYTLAHRPKDWVKVSHSWCRHWPASTQSVYW